MSQSNNDIEMARRSLHWNFGSVVGQLPVFNHEENLWTSRSPQIV